MSDIKGGADMSSGSAPQSLCPVTGLAVTSRPEWTDASLDEGYSATWFLLGDSILVGRPVGYGTMKGVEKLMERTEAIVNEFFPLGTRYIRIIDLTDFRGMSLRSRKYFSDEMRKRERTRCIIFCGITTWFSLSVQLANRLHKLPYELKMAANYREAALLAHKLSSGEDRRGSDPEEVTSGPPPPEGGEKSALSHDVPGEAEGTRGEAADSVKDYVRDILLFLEGLNWEKHGLEVGYSIRPGHPFEPVFDSLRLIKRDLDNLFHEHEIATEDLKKSHKEMWDRVSDRTADLAADNEALREALSAKEMLVTRLFDELKSGEESHPAGSWKQMTDLIDCAEMIGSFSGGPPPPQTDEFDAAAMVRKLGESSTHHVGGGAGCTFKLPAVIPVTGSGSLTSCALAALLHHIRSPASDGADEPVELTASKSGSTLEIGVKTGAFHDKGVRRPPFQSCTALAMQAVREKNASDIGLYLSWKAAELLGGTVAARSVPGKVREFKISLPVV